MPNTHSAIRFLQGTAASYAALATKDMDAIYFCTDTKQIFVGTDEYTKGTGVLNAQPTSATPGDHGKLYVYNGSLYLCQVSNGQYIWTRVANVNDKLGTVTSIGAGEGLGVASGSENPITGAGTLVHAVPEGASVHSDGLSDQTPGFGQNVQIESVKTDKFGHVTGVNKHTVKLPDETPVSVAQESAAAHTLEAGDVFEVVVEVAKGDGSHEVKRTIKSFTLPEDKNTTYTIAAGSKEGTVLITPSEGSAYEVELPGWSSLAKKSDITSVFKYKGTVNTVSELPESATEGDIYHVTSDSGEYGYFNGEWESLGSIVDLSEYAKLAQVIPRVTGETGEVPKFNEDGTLSSTGFTLGKSVPSDAKFTDTVYEHPQHTGHAKGFYKVTVDALGHVTSVEAVTKADIDALKVHAATADSATKASQDASGNAIESTYATKQEVKDAKLVWEAI